MSPPIVNIKAKPGLSFVTELKESLQTYGGVYLTIPSSWNRREILDNAVALFNFPVTKKKIMGECSGSYMHTDSCELFDLHGSVDHGLGPSTHAMVCERYLGQVGELSTRVIDIISDVCAEVGVRDSSLPTKLRIEKSSKPDYASNITSFTGFPGLLSYHLLANGTELLIKRPTGFQYKFRSVPNTVVLILHDSEMSVKYMSRQDNCCTVTLLQSLPQKVVSVLKTPEQPTELLPDHLTALLKVFKSIEASLLYYYATSKLDSISLNKLQSRVAQQSRVSLTLDHLQQILAIYPQAFELTSTRDGYVIRAPSVITAARERTNEFLKRCHRAKDKSCDVLPLGELSPQKMNLKRPASSRLESLKKIPKTSCEKSAKVGSIVDRIRAKELAGKSKEPEDPLLAYKKFINSHLDRVAAALLTLARYSGPSHSYAMASVTKKLSDSLRLSKTESEDALLALSERIPSFCSVVQSGTVKAVRVFGGWNLIHVKGRLHPSAI
jgi:hypothetical protein